jgi:hypothetical protein
VLWLEAGGVRWEIQERAIAMTDVSIVTLLSPERWLDSSQLHVVSRGFDSGQAQGEGAVCKQ